MKKVKSSEKLSPKTEFDYQYDEKEKRMAELLIAKTELDYQHEEKEKRAAELVIANKELKYQNEEKEKRAAELVIANKELKYQNQEKEKRAAELVIANKELKYQNQEKEKRAAELVIANKELKYQNEEKEKRAAELITAKELLELLNNQLEERVVERTVQLESANKELEEYSYSISHDLKAPARHITGFASLLEKKYGDLLPDEGRQYLDNILSSAENMGELIQGLLLFSRAGRVEINLNYLNMNDIVHDLVQPIIEMKTGHRIKFDIANLPSIYGDSTMLKSVWSNLIENAIKFSNNKEIAKIRVGYQESAKEITYFIEDNGVGFDMSYSQKLFKVFQRLHLKSEFEGTGIGLATIKRIITKHGGRVWAESTIGLGAKFYFALPKRNEGKL